MAMLTLLKPTKHYAEKALKAYPRKLDMKEFINYTEFPIDQEIASSFYTQMKFGIPIYLGKYEIEFFGYSGKLRKAKYQIIEALKKNFADLKNTAWWIYDNKEYEKFFVSVTTDTKKKAYPALETGRGHGKEEHILILPQLYKHLLVMAGTKKAFQIREYLFQIEHLVYCMMDYYKNFNRHEAKVVVRQKDCKIDQLLIEVKEERKKADEERKKAEKRFQDLMARSGKILDQNDNLQEEIADIGNDVLEIEEKLDSVLPDRVPTDGIRSGEYEIIVIFQFENFNHRVTSEKPFIIYKGQKNGIDEAKKKHIADLIEMRKERLGRNIRRSEIPNIAELFQVGLNGYIPRANATWKRYKREHRNHLRFSKMKTTMFSLRNGWSLTDLRETLEAKDQERTDI